MGTILKDSTAGGRNGKEGCARVARVRAAGGAPVPMRRDRPGHGLGGGRDDGGNLPLGLDETTRYLTFELTLVEVT